MGYLRCAYLSREAMESALQGPSLERLYSCAPLSRQQMNREWAVVGLRRYRLSSPPPTPVKAKPTPTSDKAAAGRKGARKGVSGKGGNA